jgi:hypothetical protein
MPQQGAALDQCGPLAQHLAGHCRAKLMGAFTWTINTGSLQGLSDHAADSGWTIEAADRRGCAQKERSMAALGPTLLQVMRNGLTDVAWKG